MYRIQKVASQIQKSLAPDFHEIGRRHGATVTISRVEVGSDLKNATVWVSLYGPDQATILIELQSQAAAWTQKLASKSTSKYSPKLTIKPDDGLAYADHINRLLK